ncbi:MAG: NAD(P)/FAD-dependent oxidoreductase [Acidocella sp.]|nr:NAD(P)/FAD-dependent oxidoreductase [Acidocella sp.]
MAHTAYDVVVIGAGAAGLFCAAMAVKRGKRVVVLDHAPNPGAKILISGGGRCNFTNLKVKAENFISANPHFSKSALAGFTPQDFIRLVEQAGIAYHEKTLGQLFCDDSAKQILDMLLRLCAGAELRLGAAVRDISYTDRFTVRTAQGSVEAPALVLATGGLSIPKLGATNFSYEAAKTFGLRVVPPRAGLVPLTFSGEDLAWMQELAGVSLPAAVSAGKRVFRENVLFTHRGLSGPAVLQISSYLTAGERLAVDMLPGQKAEEALLAAKTRRPKAVLKTILAEFLPARLAAHLASEDTRNMADLPDKFLKVLAARINRLELLPTGNEGFAKAEVTVGGVDTDDLVSKTCGARTVPGLFVIGEAVDVTGWLGGYNFQWAWSSAFAAAQAV